MPWLLHFPPCSVLWLVTELGCWLCSPGLKHHRIQRLPGINLPAKHFQDSSFQVLLSSCCRTRLGRDRVSKFLWQGLFNKSILAQRLQHCPCSISGLCMLCMRVCACAYMYHYLHLCMWPLGDLFLPAAYGGYHMFCSRSSKVILHFSGL